MKRYEIIIKYNGNKEEHFCMIAKNAMHMDYLTTQYAVDNHLPNHVCEVIRLN